MMSFGSGNMGRAPQGNETAIDRSMPAQYFPVLHKGIATVVNLCAISGGAGEFWLRPGLTALFFFCGVWEDANSQ